MRKTKFVSEGELLNVTLPTGSTNGRGYTPISHKSIIDHVKDTLELNNIELISSNYKATTDGNIALGQHFIKSSTDPDISMMFAWLNSYNKMKRFNCGIGAYVNVCLNGMFSANYGEYSRKHNGTADQEAMQTIVSQINQADVIFNQMVNDKNNMINFQMTQDLTNQIMGEVFMKDILGGHHLTIVKSELKDPTYKYGGDEDSAWHLYNHMTHAIKDVSPMTYTSKHVDLNAIFMSMINGTTSPSTVNDETDSLVDLEININSKPEVIENSESPDVEEKEVDFFDLL